LVQTLFSKGWGKIIVGRRKIIKKWLGVYVQFQERTAGNILQRERTEEVGKRGRNNSWGVIRKVTFSRSLMKKRSAEGAGGKREGRGRNCGGGRRTC